MNLKKVYANIVSAGWKKFKLKYYIIGYVRLYLPKSWYRRKLQKKIRQIERFDKEEIMSRVNYYNKCESSFSLQGKGESLDDFKYRKYCKNYFFDIYEFSRYFSPQVRIKYEMGDVTSVFDLPTIVKSRPITEYNDNSVLLKLNKARHFIFVKDRKSFEDKENKLIWRGNIYPHQKNRIDLVKKFHSHSFCDVGHVNSASDFPYEPKEKMSIYEHLKYKFIMSLEGNDVATNLKWIMSSNSIAVSPRLRYETWFMEGTLIPDYHYIQVADDFSDLEEKLLYYIQNPNKAMAIIQNANDYIAQFKDKKKEDLISLLTLQKYFENQTL